MFTDVDLMRLKSKQGYWQTVVKMNEGQSESWGFVDGNKIDDLIERLEAAEKVIEFRDSEDWTKYLDLWLRTQGL